MDAAEALLNPVGVPWQVVIDHQVSALKVDPLAGGIRGNKHLHFRVVSERLLRLHAFLATHATVNDDHRRRAPKQGDDVLFEISQGVAMLGENNQLLTWRRLGPRNVVRAGGRIFVRGALGNQRGSEDLSKQASQFAPFTILTAAADDECQRFKATERRDFSFQFADGARCRRLIEDFFLGSFNLVVWRILKILHLLGIERRSCCSNDLGCCPSLQHFEFPQSLLQPLATPA